MTTRLVAMGDHFIETTPSGRQIHLTVTEVDAEPKYPRDEDRPYVRLRRGGKDFVMSERVLLDVDWIAPASSPTERTDDGS